MKFVSALGWMLLGLCLGTMLSRAIGGPHPGASHTYAQQHAHADSAATVATNAFAAEIDSSPAN